MGPCARQAKECRGELSRIRAEKGRATSSRRGSVKNPTGASNLGKVLYNPRALAIRFVWDSSVGLKNYDWRCNLLIYKAPVAQPDRAPAF